MVSVCKSTECRAQLSEKQGVASAGGEAGARYLGEDREFHQGRVVSLAAVVWQGGTYGKS